MKERSKKNVCRPDPQTQGPPFFVVSSLLQLLKVKVASILQRGFPRSALLPAERRGDHVCVRGDREKSLYKQGGLSR